MLDVDILFVFLDDILDALFNIFTYDPNNNLFDYTVFDCLVNIFKLVSNLMSRNEHLLNKENVLCVCLECVPLTISDVIPAFSQTQFKYIVIVELLFDITLTVLILFKLISDGTH